MNTEIRLSDGVYAPLFVSRDGDKIILTMSRHTIKLGVTAAKWLQESLQLLVHSYRAEEQVLLHNGARVLSVSSYAPFTKIQGLRSDITMTDALRSMLLAWMDNKAIPQ